MKGFGSGLIWGALAGAFGLVIASEISPLPELILVPVTVGDAAAAQPPAPEAQAPAPIPNESAATAQPQAPVADAAPAAVASEQSTPPPPVPKPTAPVATEAGAAAGKPAAADAPATTDGTVQAGSDSTEARGRTAMNRPAPQVDEVAVPAGSEFAKPLPETDPALPLAAAAPATATAPTVQAPGASPALPEADTSATLAPSPDASGPAAPVTPDGEAAAPVIAAGSAAPIAPVGAAAPAAPATEATPDIAQLPPPPPLTPEEQAQSDAASAADAMTADGLAPDVEPTMPPTPLPAKLPEAEVVVLTPAPVLVPVRPLPDVASAAVASQAGDGDAPAGGLTGNVAGVITGRLPQIGDKPKTQAGAAAGADSDAVDPADMLPINRFARRFENPEGKPVFAIILIDRGDPALDRGALAKLPFPVTFALDPTLPGVAALAAKYRDAGQEVVMLATAIPAGATAADLEVTFAAHAAAIPEAVAVLDLPEGGFEGDRMLATLVVPILKGQGRGLLTYDAGLNPADQVASREQLRAAKIFRRLDATGEPVAAMRRTLDRAAFKAAQEGRVAVIGEARAETVAALMEWTVEGRAAAVALAPATAVMIAR